MLRALLTGVALVSVAAFWRELAGLLDSSVPVTAGLPSCRAGPPVLGAYGRCQRAPFWSYVSGAYSDGSVQIEQHNMFGYRSYSIMHVKAPRYIYDY